MENYRQKISFKITQEIKEEVLDHLTDGCTLASYLNQKNRPFSRRNFFYELKKDPAFAEEYKLARELGADKISEDILSIVDNESLSVARANLMASWRYKMLSTWFPKNYGQTKLTADSEDTSLDHMNQDELQALLSQQLSRLGLEVVDINR
mgnify:CR=1 FL=1